MRALSDYAIGERLGAGSFGETFAAVHQPSGREVAIKVLRIKDAPDWKAIELFEREGETLARLSHPGIAAYLDAFVVTEEGAGEAFYLVQERIFGGSLGARLARGEVMTAAEVTGLLRELARVLEYIHGVNPPVIHRDLKPSNIMCRSNTDQLRFALIDFGAIQIALPRADGQAGSTIIGTTGYMPTEQLLGRTGPASDLYALGATAVHALTGVHPAEMAIKRLRLEWREHLPSATNLPDQLGAVLDALLAPAVEDRIASGAELIRRLNIRQAIKGTPPAPAPPKALPMGLKAFFGLTLGLGTLFILALAVLSLSDDPQDTYVQDHPIGLILEDEHPSILPIRLETVADLARAMGPGVELPDEALKVTLRGFRNDTYPAAAILIENTSKRAWSKVRVAWFLQDEDNKTLAIADTDLVAGYEGALQPDEVLGKSIQWGSTVAGASHIVARILGAEHEAPVESVAQPLEVSWAAPAQDGLSLSFQLLSLGSAKEDLASRHTHLPRIAVTNVGAVPVASLRVHKHLWDPSGHVAPIDKDTWAIPTGAPSLLPGETRTFTVWSWENAALSEWSLSVRDVRVGTRL